MNSNQDESQVSHKRPKSNNSFTRVDKSSRSKGKKNEKTQRKERKAFEERKVKYEPEFKYISASFMKYPLTGMAHAQERPIYEKVDVGGNFGTDKTSNLNQSSNMSGLLNMNYRDGHGDMYEMNQSSEINFQWHGG